jgi:hypothetical protein
MIRFYFILYFLINTTAIFAQPLQSIRGIITDKSSNSPISFANIELLNTATPQGAITDTLGNFEIIDIPVGRYDLKISYAGYETTFVREILVNSAKQTFLNISLKESTSELDEIVVEGRPNKDLPLNSMATVSGKMFSVEEAKRYAGGFDDPSRLASAFAGVASNPSLNNSMIVRGNAPKYFQWKMEGIEIPNPNHFGDLKVVGGGIFTGLSSQMLANSDFFTGAFPAEYNNAISGVFDISMRKGATQKREHTIEVGVIGVDVASEGSFKKGGKASYLFNYRNSTLQLLAPLLPENANSVRYQNLSFKLNFPTKNAGTFSLWGLGLRDGATAKPKKDSTDWKYSADKQYDEIKQEVGALGLTHKYFFNEKTYLNTTLATTALNTEWNAEKLDATHTLKPFSRISNKNFNFVLSSYINKKFGAKHTNRSGILITAMSYETFLNKSLIENAPPTEIVNSNGFSTLFSAYSSSSIALNNALTLNIGINGQFFALNERYTIEPRVGLSQMIGQKHTLGVAYGLHSRLEKLNYYFNNSLSTNEKAVNNNLDFTKAHHFVLSYAYNISDLLHLKVEPYYQRLYAVPVVVNSSTSFINLENDWFFAEKLENTGESENIGVDLTLEKYMSKGYYYMVTASVFDAKYKGGDGEWRNTRFNRNFVFNFLVGKEWLLGKTKQNILGVNLRASYQGGNRYSPINQLLSAQNKEVIYDQTRAFSEQIAPTLAIHFTTSYKIHKKKSAHEFALKILNVTNEAEFYGHLYNIKENVVDKELSSSVLPNLSYKFEF